MCDLRVAISADRTGRSRGASRRMGAVDLHWAAVASEESIADDAYDYALRYQPGTGRRTFSWMCPACQHQVTDNGPWPDPPEQEDGHAADCARRTAQLDAWRRRTSGRG